MRARVRPATAAEDDARFLRAMLYEAAAWRPDADHPDPDALLAEPAIARYVEGWGRPGDDGVIAESADATPVGAAWYRLFAADEPGFGFVSASVPELSIAVVAASRGHGVGGALLAALVARARDDGHPALSLSVEEGNPAARLYERVGFVPAGGTGGAHTLLLDL